MRILVVCHYFAPEPGAPQARWLETAGAWAESGHDVTVITGFPNHPSGVLRPGDRGRWLRQDRLRGIRVLRCWQYATPNRGILRKTLGHLSFMVSSVVLGAPRARRPDVIVVSSPTFFSVFSAWVLGKLWRRPFVFEVRDLWPAIFTELGVLENRRVIALLEKAELFLYRAAARVIPVTEGFREDIVRRGIPAEKVVTVTNGVDTARWRPREDRGPIRERLGLEGRFVALYIGAHGISHALARILEVAERWRGDPDVRFVFVGEGAEKAALVARAEERGLGNVEFRPAVGKEEVADWYAAADVCLVPLRDVPLFRTFLPSKMFEIMGSGRPILASVAGEAARILEESGAAVVVGPEDVEGLDRGLRELRSDPARARAMGRRGAEFVRRNFDRGMLARRYARVLQEAVREAER